MIIMDFTKKEKAIALIANAIAVYSLYSENNTLPENTNLIDFVLKAIPDDIKPEINIELVDSVFEYVSNAHS